MSSEANTLTERLQRYRYTGARGTPITMHRALRRIRLSRSALASILLLPLLFDMALWYYAEALTTFWAQTFQFWIDQLQLAGRVLYTDTGLFGQSLYVPYPDLPAALPSQEAVMTNLIACVLLLLLADFIPARFMPAVYLLRAALVIQASSSIYFILHPYQPPYEMGDYLSALLAVGIYLMFLCAPLLATIYYIFDLPFWRKAVATALTLTYFAVALPFQYLLHAIIISSGSMLFMPVLYILLGALLNTFMFVCCYALAMTWGKN